MIHSVKRSGERLLNRFQRESRSAETDTFVYVLEHESVLAFVVTAACAPEANVVSDHRLKLERDVLDDVGRVRAVTKADDEPPSLADAATISNLKAAAAFCVFVLILYPFHYSPRDALR